MALAEPKAIEVDGRAYLLPRVPASRALAIFPDVLDLLGEPMALLLISGGSLSTGDLMAVFEEGGQQGVSDLLRRFSSAARKLDGGLTGFSRRLLEGVTAKVKIGEAEVDADVSAHFDDAFTGDLLHLVKVNVAVMRSIFSNL